MDFERLYEVRPRKDHRGVDLISDALPFGKLWYGEPAAVSNAVGYAKFYSRSSDVVVRVFDESAIWSKRMSRLVNSKSHERACHLVAFY